MCLNYIQIKEIHNNHFTKCGQICEYISALAKSKVSRGKLNYLHQANDSTPFNRAFFVRNIRTPKEFADFVLSNLKIHSMVERNRQSLTGCPPDVAVFHPVMLYRPTVESLAVDSKNQHQESTQMYQFIFAAIRRTGSNQSHSKNPYHRRHRTSRTRSIRPRFCSCTHRQNQSSKHREKQPHFCGNLS